MQPKPITPSFYEAQPTRLDPETARKRHDLMARFGMLDTDLQDDRIVKGLARKIELDRKVKRLKGQQYTNSLISTWANKLGFSAADVSRPPIGRMIKGLIDSELFIDLVRRAAEEK